MAVVLFDIFKGHSGGEIESLLLENNIISVIVPSNCTDVLQSMDLSVNKPLKDHLRSKFQSWYSEQVTKQMNDGKQPEDIEVDMKLSVMKPLSARWIISAYDYLIHEGGIVLGGFVEAGIREAVDKPESDPESEEDDPFADVWYVTRKTYLFPQTRRVGFPRAAARQYADARAAIRGSSARQCVDAPRIYTMRNLRMSAKAYALDRRRVLAAEAVSLQSPYH